MMRNPYDVLGVAKTASASDIKSAFRKLAKKYHPDQSKEPKAKERFAEVGSAYEILGDDKKRAAFDRGEIDAEGKPRAPNSKGSAPAGRARAQNSAISASTSAAADFRRRAAGSTRTFFRSCSAPAGRSRTRTRSQAQRGEDIAVTIAVPLATAALGGSVRVALPNGRTLDAAVPAGIEEGKSIRLRGQGHPGNRGTPAGDVIVTIRYAAHPLFKAEGRDLRLDLPITLYEAVLGGKVRVPTLGGEVEMSIAPGMSGGRVLRLRGKGLPATGEQPAGDLLATVRIVLPNSADGELTELMRKWRDHKPYDPRSS